ncbi:hypothetical protein [Streptomyces glomeratus]|uniref:Ig-like domain-containing protein n=1 Tax=Streptomyces glomeratus TaxID=284452 RepID=A0ABP6LY49_9ACTN|nr:hypothetical protein [Streptomyces glomeratus]MCF1506202.1 hypothetical protein [Streptomyces glomeratus]
MSRTKLLALAAVPALALGLASPALAVNMTDPNPVASSPVEPIAAGQTKIVVVTCPAGTSALSGGWNVSSATIDVTGNRAMSSTQWQIQFQNESQQPGNVQAFARCAA